MLHKVLLLCLELCDELLLSIYFFEEIDKRLLNDGGNVSPVLQNTSAAVACNWRSCQRYAEKLT